METHSFWGQKVKAQGHKSQTQCRCGSLHSCECRLLLVCPVIQRLQYRGNTPNSVRLAVVVAVYANETRHMAHGYHSAVKLKTYDYVWRRPRYESVRERGREEGERVFHCWSSASMTPTKQHHQRCIYSSNFPPFSRHILPQSQFSIYLSTYCTHSLQRAETKPTTIWRTTAYGYIVVMGESPKKKSIRFDSLQRTRSACSVNCELISLIKP